MMTGFRCGVARVYKEIEIRALYVRAGNQIL